MCSMKVKHFSRIVQISVSEANFKVCQEILTCYMQVLVQLGDILDRGEDEIAILSLLRSLNIQAESSGGAVFQVWLLTLDVRICL